MSLRTSRKKEWAGRSDPWPLSLLAFTMRRKACTSLVTSLFEEAHVSRYASRYQALVGLLAGLLCQGSDWPGFRGPDGNAVSPDRGVPVHWSVSENVVWKTKLPGFGTSSPIVAGDRL